MTENHDKNDNDDDDDEKSWLIWLIMITMTSKRHWIFLKELLTTIREWWKYRKTIWKQKLSKCTSMFFVDKIDCKSLTVIQKKILDQESKQIILTMFSYIFGLLPLSLMIVGEYQPLQCSCFSWNHAAATLWDLLHSIFPPSWSC